MLTKLGVTLLCDQYSTASATRIHKRRLNSFDLTSSDAKSIWTQPLQTKIIDHLQTLGTDRPITELDGDVLGTSIGITQTADRDPVEMSETVAEFKQWADTHGYTLSRRLPSSGAVLTRQMLEKERTAKSSHYSSLSLSTAGRISRQFIPMSIAMKSTQSMTEPNTGLDVST